MLADIVPEVAVEDLEGVIAFAIERNLISWEQVAIACVEYAQKKDDHLAAALVWPFVWLDRHVAAVRKHGYLLATVAIKPRP